MYDFIVNYMRSEGKPPTNREIGRELQIPSTGHVDYHLTMLEKKGLISRQPKRSRGIERASSPTGIPVMGSIAAGEPFDILLTLTCSDDVQDRYQGLIIFRRLGLHIKEQEIPILDLLAKKKDNT